MNRKFKMIPIRLLSLALCVLLLCGSAPAAGMTYFADLLSLSAAAESYSGTCGDTLTWTLEDGVLTISGTNQPFSVV